MRAVIVVTDTKSKTCCFTGHRKIPSGDQKQISGRLEKVLVSYIEQGYLYFGAGGAVGFDMLAAETVLKLKNQYPAIKLILVLPCKEHCKYWSIVEKIRFACIMRRADKIVYTAHVFTQDCMRKRNRHLVDNSSLCICYLTKSTGGTAYMVNYARRTGRSVINLAE